MKTLTQSEATVSAIVNLSNEKGYDAQPFETDYKEVLSKDDIKVVVSFVTAGLTDGSITMKEQSKEKFKDDPKGLKNYVVGLVNDRLRKAKALNGNVSYKAKEPGKFKNARDPKLKALHQVLSIATDDDIIAEIETEIAKRQSELNVPKEVEIDYSVLPDNLRDILKK